MKVLLAAILHLTNIEFLEDEDKATYVEEEQHLGIGRCTFYSSTDHDRQHLVMS